MISAPRLREELASIGYSAIESDYVFPDVFASPPHDRIVELAAFTHEPPSYRNAALAVVEIKQGMAREIAADYRALGAPLLFAIEGEEVTIWEVRADGRPTVHQRAKLDQLHALFYDNRDSWSPRRIHEAKSFGLLNRSYQLSFVDAGLLPAIEGEFHGRLDRLLNETLAETVRLRIIRPGERIDDRLVFRTIFRLLAAKVLQDRGHELAGVWNPSDIDTVLRGISEYYKLPPLPGEARSFKGTVFDAAWDRFRDAINFRNISSDDLAFVYEKTLITDETRDHFGTHSTPRSVAEYVVSHLELKRHDISKIDIYDPFAGAGVFMVAALRYLRDLLPFEMSEIDRHHFLVDRITGDEIDSFATEVAALSLILADYPYENGWAITQIDLFEKYVLRERAQGRKVILCNPPFGRFSREERLRYREAFARSPFKQIAALEGVLDAQPAAIGFVLPDTFINGLQYERQRRRVEEHYKEIEIVELPDGVFRTSMIRSSLLIARAPRARGDATTHVRSTVIKTADRERFLKTGEASDTRAKVRPLGQPPGDLWIEELDEVWEYLADLPVFGSAVQVHKGIEWKKGQMRHAVSDKKQDGFYAGIAAANAVRAYALNGFKYLDFRSDSFAERTGAFKRPWQKPKILTNAARISRGPWCFAAAVDRKGLLASQQLFGIWPKDGSTETPLEVLCALLNSPIAVAYIASHSRPDRIRVGTLKAVPIPTQLPIGLKDMVQRYTTIVEGSDDLFVTTFAERASNALNEIDAALLAAYDLPPRLERRLLEYFRGDERPTVHPWQHWYPEDFTTFLPLRRYLSAEFNLARSGWVLNVFKPLPKDEASALREYLD